MSQRRDRTSRGGRPSSLGEAKALIALWGSLTADGSTINANVVAQRLGIDSSAAKRLLDLLVSARGGDADYLPLYSPNPDAEETVSLLPQSNNVGRNLRITSKEYAALISALDTLGVGPDDPLRAKIEKCRTRQDDHQGVSELIAKTLTAAYSNNNSQALFTCAGALASSTDLTFAYQGSLDDKRHIRRVTPSRIRHDDANWYLDAFDHVRHAQRTFRIDRMSDVSTSEMVSETEPAASTTNSSRLVQLTFINRDYLTALDWPGMEVTEDDGRTVTAVIPYYEQSSTWLVRRITSSGGGVITSDASVRRRVGEYAQQLLSSLDAVHSEAQP